MLAHGRPGDRGHGGDLVAEQLGHANPELTLRVYAHALPSESGDLGFADFGSPPDSSSTTTPLTRYRSDTARSCRRRLAPPSTFIDTSRFRHGTRPRVHGGD